MTSAPPHATELKTLADRLRYARMCANNMTQAQLARRVGCAQSRIAYLETSGKYSQYVPAVASALNVNAIWLMQGTGPMRPTNDINGLYNRCSEQTRRVIDALIAEDQNTTKPDLPSAIWPLLEAARRLVPNEPQPLTSDILR